MKDINESNNNLSESENNSDVSLDKENKTKNSLESEEEILNLNDELQEKINKLDSDFKDLNDKYLRCLAEYDNFRKRTTKEKERLFSDGIIYSIKGILDVLDNFERALKCETKDLEMKKGFEMIFNQLSDTLKKLGIEEIKTENETFDPSIHNAVMHIEDDNYETNQVVETLQKGYKLGDNIIRYAMVKVAN